MLINLTVIMSILTEAGWLSRSCWSAVSTRAGMQCKGDRRCVCKEQRWIPLSFCSLNFISLLSKYIFHRERWPWDFPPSSLCFYFSLTPASSWQRLADAYVLAPNFFSSSKLEHESDHSRVHMIRAGPQPPNGTHSMHRWPESWSQIFNPRHHAIQDHCKMLQPAHMSMRNGRVKFFNLKFLLDIPTLQIPARLLLSLRGRISLTLVLLVISHGTQWMQQSPKMLQKGFCLLRSITSDWLWGTLVMISFTGRRRKPRGM